MALQHLLGTNNHLITTNFPATMLRKLGVGFLALISLYYILLTLYNLLFHPLRRFPGPLLARVSRLWSRVGNFKGRKSERIHQAHLKYGTVVRVGPNELSFSEPRAVRDIYASDNFIKEESFYRAKRIFHEEFLLSFRNPEAHKERRKLLSRGFSQAAMLEFEPHIDTKIEATLKQWASRVIDDPVIEVYEWVHWLGFDIVYHLLFNEDPGSVKFGRPHEVMPYFRAWKPTFIYKEFFPQLEKWGVYIPGPIGGYFRAVGKWKKYAEAIIQKCREQGTTTPFLRHILYEEKDGFLGRPLTNSEIAEECMGGMFGGSGTTANTFVYLLWASLQKPQVVQRLKEELVTAFPDQQTIPDYRTCTGLPLLQAVINETLRLYPTIVATLPRTAIRDTVVQGIPIPRGTTVGTQNYTIHRSETAYPHPEEWNPDRWLDETGVAIRKEAFTPFSIGSRKCIGINLAQMELNKITAAFFLRFDASIHPSMEREEMRMYDTFNAAPAGARLLLRLKETGK